MSEVIHDNKLFVNILLLLKKAEGSGYTKTCGPYSSKIKLQIEL